MDTEEASGLRFFEPRSELRIWSNRLPHWEQQGAVVFLTFRLADSLPQHLLHPWQRDRDAWRAAHPPPWAPDTEREYHRRFSAPIDAWLDAGFGSCLLREPEHAGIVASAMRHGDGETHHLISWVVMPNHVHVLFGLTPSVLLSRVVKAWKGVSARQLNDRLGRTGKLWQPDYFDRLVRDQEHLGRCVRYIRRNPEKAHLQPGGYLLEESDRAREIA